ncbi:MAG TPA: hypothetical protein VGG25_14195 [Streptosporangiaceae bacterium]
MSVTFASPPSVTTLKGTSGPVTWPSVLVTVAVSASPEPASSAIPATPESAGAAVRLTTVPVAVRVRPPLHAVEQLPCE